MGDSGRVGFMVAGSDGHPVVADLYSTDPLKGDTTSTGAVILCHGFKGHRRWGFIPDLAGRMQAAGLTAIAIDFSHNGHLPPVGAGTDTHHSEFVSPELFRANTLARERQDLLNVLAHLRDPGSGPPTIAAGTRVGLWGHSRGGVAVIDAALSEPGIGAISTWSTVANPDTYSDRQKSRWCESGALAFTDNDSGTPLAIGIDYLRDLTDHADRYHLAHRAGDLRVPHLIIHGEHDLAVPVENGQALYDTAELHADKKLLRVLTGHTFGYESGVPPNDVLTQSTNATAEWFLEYLETPRGAEKQA